MNFSRLSRGLSFSFLPCPSIEPEEPLVCVRPSDKGIFSRLGSGRTGQIQAMGRLFLTGFEFLRPLHEELEASLLKRNPFARL